MDRLTILQARTKLRQRHLLEWDRLALTQQQVLVLVRAGHTQPVPTGGTDNGAEVKTQQARHLMTLLKRQQDERQQLLRRHGQEDAWLENEIDPRPNR